MSADESRPAARPPDEPPSEPRDGASGPLSGEDASVERELFLSCLSLPADEWGSFLEQQCGTDGELRSRVEGLLEVHCRCSSSDRFLERPALELAQPIRSQPELWIGRRVGDYTIHSVLGVGGTSVVFEAERVGEPGRPVALKLLLQDISDPEGFRLFARERRILGELDHPSIARLLDTGTTDAGLSFLVMEKIEGEPITRFCDARGLVVRERLKLFVAVCAAVEEAHRNLVVHRDLKPSNILVTDAGEPKLLDFGIAKPLEERIVDVPTTDPAERRLTMGYASPEQVSGHRATTSADVYSLGVVLYELLAGCLPFDWRGHSAREVAAELERRSPPRPSSCYQDWSSGEAGQVAGARQSRAEQLRQQLRGDLDSIVLRALEVDPRRRYDSVAALRADLERHLRGLPVEARPPTLRYVASRFVRRHRWALAAAGLALSILAAGGLAIRSQASRAERERRTAEAATDFLVRSLFDRRTGAVELEKSLSADELDRVQHRVRSDFAAQPALQAQLLVVLAQLYRSRGDLDSASAILEEVLASPPSGDQSTAVAARAEQYLATVRYDEGRFAESAALSRRALQRRSAEGVGGYELAEGKTLLAWTLKAMGELAEAESLAREALTEREQIFGPDHETVAESWSALGAILDDTGRYGEAKEAFQRALAIARRGSEGEASTMLSDILSHYLNVQLHLQENELAEQTALEALEIQRRLLPEDHPKLLEALGNLGGVQFGLRRFDAAAESFREALALQRRTLGERHPDVVTTLANLGATLNFAGRPAEAEGYLAESIELQREHLGARHPTVAVGLTNLSIAHEFQGDYAAAERCLREALEIDLEAYGEQHPRVAGGLHLLGSILMLRHDYTESVEVRTRAVSVRRQLLAAATGDATRTAELELAKTLSGLAEALAEAEDFEAAAANAREVIELHEKHAIAVGDHRVARGRAVLGYALARLGDESGRSLLGDAHSALVAERGPDYVISRLAAEWSARLERQP